MRVGSLIRVAGASVALAWFLSMLLVVRWHLGLESALKITAAALLAVVGLAVFIGWSWLFERRARIILQKWASENRYEILERRSPFHTSKFSFWTTSRGQIVYFVRVRDTGCHERSAWVRCGSFWSSLLSSDDIEVRWSDHETRTS